MSYSLKIEYLNLIIFQKQHMRKISLVLFLSLFLNGCPGPGSKFYSPPDYIQEVFLQANKIAMPNDILKQPEKYVGQEIHWIGILKEFNFIKDGYALITLEQKYWDYIEDYSIQTERIFLSPKGEGLFYLLFPYSDRKEFEIFIKEAIAREDLMFVYGVFDKIKNGHPLLKYTQGSFVHEKYYSTKIWEYGILRDAKGNVVPDERNLPTITKVKVLKVPGPGKND